MEVRVKRYSSVAAADRDAKRMAAAGWQPQGLSGGGKRTSLGRGAVNKTLGVALLGPVGLFASSKKDQPVTVTWTRTPEAAAEAQARAEQQQADKAAAREARAAERLAAVDPQEKARILARIEAHPHTVVWPRELASVTVQEVRAARGRGRAARRARKGG